jgi:NADH dehydrogenase FAD-containing subunit
MLAASATGTVEFKSICDPIRNVNTFVDYLEATASSINYETNQITCQSLKCEGTSCEFLDFEVNYDYLLVAVGASTNTYGIKGVRENCLFLKQIDDASNIRRAIVNCFERANVPQLSEEDIRTALSFVIVGAGPTGVEFTGELRDWLEYEGRKYYSGLLKYVKITLIEAGNYILPVFDEALRQEALKDLTGIH